MSCATNANRSKSLPAPRFKSAIASSTSGRGIPVNMAIRAVVIGLSGVSISPRIVSTNTRFSPLTKSSNESPLRTASRTMGLRTYPSAPNKVALTVSFIPAQFDPQKALKQPNGSPGTVVRIYLTAILGQAHNIIWLDIFTFLSHVRADLRSPGNRKKTKNQSVRHPFFKHP